MYHIDECTKLAGQACLHPDRMRYSIESLGGNVVKTAEELLGVRLQWTHTKDIKIEYTVLCSADPTDRQLRGKQVKDLHKTKGSPDGSFRHS